ncbi:hypothetical protein [Streptomyces sp. NPDC002587]
MALALITGQREPLAARVLTDPEIFARNVTAGAAYGQALQDHLRGTDPGPAVERARSTGWPVPVVSPYLPEELVTRYSLVSGHVS